MRDNKNTTEEIRRRFKVIGNDPRLAMSQLQQAHSLIPEGGITPRHDGLSDSANSTAVRLQVEALTGEVKKLHVALNKMHNTIWRDRLWSFTWGIMVGVIFAVAVT